MRLWGNTHVSTAGRPPLGGLTLALAAFAIVGVTLQTTLPIFFDSGYPEFDLRVIVQLGIVGMAWCLLGLAGIRPTSFSLMSLTIILVICGLILAPVIIVAAVYRTWLVVVPALGCPAALAAAARSISTWRRRRN